MSLLLGLRRVSQSFNTLIRCRSLAHHHFNTQSCSRRVLFLAERFGPQLPSEQCFYSANIFKDGTLGPATRLPPTPIPFRSHISVESSWSTTAVLNDKISLHVGSHIHIYSPNTGEDSTFPDYPQHEFEIGFYNCFCGHFSYFGVDPLSNEHKVLFLQMVINKTYLWVFTPASGSWRRIEPRVPGPGPYKFDFPGEDEKEKVVFANGAIHLFICHAFDRRTFLPVKFILVFDMKEEKFRKISLPYDSDSFSGKLIQTCGRLAFIEDVCGKRCGGSLDHELKFWILEDYKWVYKPIHFPFSCCFVYTNLLAFNYITGKMLLQFRDTTLFLYCNTKTGTFREVQVSGFPHGNGSKHDYFGFRVIDVKFG